MVFGSDGNRGGGDTLVATSRAETMSLRWPAELDGPGIVAATSRLFSWADNDEECPRGDAGSAFEVVSETTSQSGSSSAAVDDHWNDARG